MKVLVGKGHRQSCRSTFFLVCPSDPTEEWCPRREEKWKQLKVSTAPTTRFDCENEKKRDAASSFSSYCVQWIFDFGRIYFGKNFTFVTFLNTKFLWPEGCVRFWKDNSIRSFSCGTNDDKNRSSAVCTILLSNVAVSVFLSLSLLKK